MGTCHPRSPTHRAPESAGAQVTYAAALRTAPPPSAPPSGPSTTRSPSRSTRRSGGESGVNEESRGRRSPPWPRGPPTRPRLCPGRGTPPDARRVRAAVGTPPSSTPSPSGLRHCRSLASAPSSATQLSPSRTRLCARPRPYAVARLAAPAPIGRQGWRGPVNANRCGARHSADRNSVPDTTPPTDRRGRSRPRSGMQGA